MTYSLNEIEGLCKKAARGSGMSWGMAEEAAKAVRWLVSVNLAGPAQLVDLLALHDEMLPVSFAPVTCARVWRASSGSLCPIASGAALCDHVEVIAWDEGVEMVAVAHPLLLLPFAAAVSARLGKPITMAWGQAQLHVSAGKVWIDDPLGERGIAQAGTVSLWFGQAPFGQPLPPSCRGTIDTEVWAQLNTYAHRTYAPATEASRNLGAGAGVSDND